MSSTNFAAAQQRVLERRRRRETEAQSRLAEQQRTSVVNHPAVKRLPYPLNTLPQSGFSLWDAIKGREGTRPAFRVGQVDAELLDEELLSLLKGQVGDALKYFGVCFCGTSLEDGSLTYLSFSLTCAMTGRTKSNSPCVRSSSNSHYGTTMLPTVLRCKA